MAGIEILHLRQPKVVFSQPFPLPAMPWAVLFFPEVNYHLCLQGRRSTPQFTTGFLPCWRDCVGPGLLFPRKQVENDGGGHSLLTHKSPPKSRAACRGPGIQCGAAVCGDRSGIFCIFCFALAWPWPACEGGMTPKGVTAGARTILRRQLSRNSHHPKPDLAAELYVASFAEETCLPVLPHALFTVTITDGKSQTHNCSQATSSQQTFSASRRKPRAYIP